MHGSDWIMSCTIDFRIYPLPPTRSWINWDWALLLIVLVNLAIDFIISFFFSDIFFLKFYFRNVPVCLRLLFSNGYSCDCCDSALRSELETLLSLFHSLLQLIPASDAPSSRQGRSKNETSKKTSIVWPWSSVLPASTNGKTFLRRIYRLLTHLPSFIRNEPLLLSLVFSSFQEVDALSLQPLIFSTLRLALSCGSVMVPAGGLQRHPCDLVGRSLVWQKVVKARPELHATWFRFLLNSLTWWGSATTLMIHVVISQLGAGLRSLTAPFYIK